MSRVAKLKQRLKIKDKKLGLFEIIWLASPLFLWFSYQPLIRFGQDSTMYFEISLAVAYILILALVGVPIILKERAKLAKNKAVILVGILILVTAFSLIWTPNPTRGILTLGVAGLLYMIFMAGLAIKDRLKKIAPALAAVLLVSATLISIAALMQMFLGMWFSQSVTLLCDGCVAGQFGFVRPNVFAIEPQFLGSMLLAPIMLSVWLISRGNRNKWLILSLFITSTAMFLTLSRGAIFALALALVVFMIASWRDVLKTAKPIGIVVAGLLISLLLQGFTAAINPNINESFLGAVSKSINQLSLGIVDIQIQDKPAESSSPTNTVTKNAADDQVKQPNYDGYVEESTNVRLHRSEMALSTWSESPTTKILGVGIGGAGVAMHNNFPDETIPREIVQNEFVERLLETGIIGLGLFMIAIISVLAALFRQKAWWALALILAFIVQWNFFSGYPNALHIYILLILAGVGVLSVRRGGSQSAKQY